MKSLRIYDPLISQGRKCSQPITNKRELAPLAIHIVEIITGGHGRDFSEYHPWVRTYMEWNAKKP